MKVVVVGAGIAGLSTYLHLQKHLPNPESHTVTILERHVRSATEREENRFMGGLGVAPNGMRVLRRLDESLHAEIRRLGYVCETFSFRTAGGWRLGTWQAATKRPTKEGMLMIDRNDLWAALRQRVPDDAIREGAHVADVKPDGSVVLESGGTLQADLVIGADGVWSTVRRFVIDENESGRDPVSQGLMNVGGQMPISYLDNLKQANKEPPCVMTFGQAGFVGYTPVSAAPRSGAQSPTQPPTGPRAMWWATYEAEPETTPRRTTSFPTDPRLRAAFKQRHADWADPAINRLAKALVANAEDVTLNLETPTWIVPELARWHRGRLVLVGDAAHALPSTSGQGVSQGLEDSAVLALLVARFLRTRGDGQVEPRENGLEEVLSSFQRSRKPRVERILAEAAQRQGAKRGNGVVVLVIMYVAMFFIFRVFGMRDGWKLEYGAEEEVGRLEACSESAQRKTRDKPGHRRA